MSCNSRPFVSDSFLWALICLAHKSYIRCLQKKKKKLQKVQKEYIEILKMSYMSTVVHGVLLI